MKKKDVYDGVIERFIVNTFGRIYDRIQTYRINPAVIESDLRWLYHDLKYRLLQYIDPPPRQKRKELTTDYFERIDPKYGLRFYECMVNKAMNIDLATAIPHIIEEYKDKKARKLMMDLVTMTAEIERLNAEGYEKYKIRNELLKNQDA